MADAGAMRGETAAGAEGTRWQKLAWVMYDWANSGYGLVVVGPVFSPYFISQLLPLLPGSADDHGIVAWGVRIPGSAMMGLLNSLSMGLMAVGAPVLGAVADIRGWTRRLLIVSATLGSVLAMLMWFLEPGRWALGATLFVASNFCFGTSFTFYNAYLPRLTRPERQGSLSGWGFAAGYVGGAIALILGLMLIRRGTGNVPAALALAGAWWLIFSLPAFWWLPDTPPQGGGGGSVLLAGFRQVKTTLGNVRQYRMLFLFLLAFLLYNDGVETVISMSPAFATDVLKMPQEQLIGVFLLVQFVAFVGAAGFGYLADRIGNKAVIFINLSVWVVAALLALLVKTPTQFAMLGAMIGVVLGGVQSSSRALMAQLSPEHIRNEAFGFFAISGKFASIFGPLLYAGLATGVSPRAGVVSVLPFLAGGLLVLVFVRAPRTSGDPAR